MERRNDEAAREIAALTSAKPRIEDVARSVIAATTPREPGVLISRPLEEQLDRAYASVRETCEMMALAASPDEDNAASRMTLPQYQRRFEAILRIERAMSRMRISIDEHRVLMLAALMNLAEIDEIIGQIEREERAQVGQCARCGRRERCAGRAQ